MFQGLFVDGFAGGGGASTGIAQAIGRDVDIAINHSPAAIAIHKANHPGTIHYCQDIRAMWPRAVTKMQPVAGAWFSPDCKEHSKAKGGPVKDRNIRALPWEIPVWLEETRPTVCYLENVEEYEDWGELDEFGIVIKETKGKVFKRWTRACRSKGYKLKWRQLRACDFGAPTSRKRLYIIMRCDGLPIVWPKPTHGRPDSPGVRRGRLLPYRTAAECIDWSIPCPSIFDRKRELKPATHRRIAHGVMRYVVNAAEPFIVPVTHSQNSPRAHSVQEPLRTVTTANGGEFAAVDAELAFLAGTSYTNTRASRVFSPGDPLRTATTQADHAVVSAHITKFHSGSVGSPMDKEMPTVTSNGDPVRPAGAMPLGLVGATLVRTGHGEADVTGKKRGKGHHDLGEPAPTVTSSRDEALAAATMVQIGYGEREGQAPRAIDIEKPLGTIMGGGGKHAQVSAFLSTFNGSDKANGGGDPLKPAKTIRASGQHHAVIAAHIEQANTGSIGHTPRKPLSTIVGKGCTQRIVETTLIEEGALPPEMMKRAVMVAAFLVKYYGEGGQSQAVDRPIDVVTAKARYAVVTVTIDAVTYVIVDIGLRMLKPRELARAQGFPEDYILNPVVPKIKRGKLVHEPLTIAEQISAIGNSVCPPVARALVNANQPGLAELRLAA